MPFNAVKDVELTTIDLHDFLVLRNILLVQGLCRRRTLRASTRANIGGTYMYALTINVVFLADRRLGKGGVRHGANDLQASANDNFEEKSRRRWG